MFQQGFQIQSKCMKEKSTSQDLGRQSRQIRRILTFCRERSSPTLRQKVLTMMWIVMMVNRILIRTVIMKMIQNEVLLFHENDPKWGAVVFTRGIGVDLSSLVPTFQEEMLQTKSFLRHSYLREHKKGPAIHYIKHYCTSAPHQKKSCTALFVLSSPEKKLFGRCRSWREHSGRLRTTSS